MRTAIRSALTSAIDIFRNDPEASSAEYGRMLDVLAGDLETRLLDVSHATIDRVAASMEPGRVLNPSTRDNYRLFTRRLLAAVQEG